MKRSPIHTTFDGINQSTYKVPIPREAVAIFALCYFILDNILTSFRFYIYD